MSGGLSKINVNDYKPLRDVIFDSIREAIVSGELKPNQRLMEATLAEKMGVSRTPVREAIRMLELDGLVVMLPRKGAHVAELSVKDMADVLEVRAALDGLATGLSAQRITDGEIAELKEVFAQLTGFLSSDNLEETIKMDMKFHEIIYRSARNDKLNQMISNLSEHVQRFRVIYLKGSGSKADIILEHQEIVDAISARNSIIAKEAAENHIRMQEAAILKAIRKD